MSDRTDYEDAVARVQQRVAEGRASGLYPETLEAQLANQFQRASVDPLTFPGLEALRQRVAALKATTFSRARIEVTSSLPGGSQIHRLVGKVVARQVEGVLTQLIDFSRAVTNSLDGVIDSLDELRAVVTTEVFGDIDAVHHRLVEVEQRLARLEAAVQPPAAETD